MERRLIVVIVLSIVVLLTWSALVSKFYPVDNTIVTEQRPQTTTSTPPLIPPSAVKSLPQPPGPQSSSYIHSQANYDLVFTESQAAIREVIFKDYQNSKFALTHGLALGDPNLVFTKKSATHNSLTFVASDADKKIIKRFIFYNDNYNIELEIELENLSPAPLQINLPLMLGVLNFGGNQNQARFQSVVWAVQDKTSHFNGRGDKFFDKVIFLAIRGKYFCAIVEPELDNYTGFIRKINTHESEVGLNSPEIMLQPGQRLKKTFYIYLGPQELQIITRAKPDWTRVMYFGIFNFIAHLLLQFIGFLYGLVKNWGVVIIMLGTLIYTALFPLTLKQMRSMKHMQALQPKIEELRKAYKDQPQKLNKEIMELYREYKVNPLSGCLPMVLQIPVFFALYQVLMRSVALKGAHFLWIKDLSEPDRLFTLPVSLPVLGNEINLLPILMTIGMFIQQKVSLQSASGGSAEQQKLMGIIFPLMFGFIFYHMPAGLVLYWFVYNLFTVIYQLRINRGR